MVFNTNCLLVFQDSLRAVQPDLPIKGQPAEAHEAETRKERPHDQGRLRPDGATLTTNCIFPISFYSVLSKWFM